MTKTTFYRKVLEHLCVIAAEENPEPTDIRVISDRYVSLYDMLRTEELVSWALAEDIPDNLEIPLVMLMAAVTAREFGIDPTPYQANFQPTMVMLRRQLAKKYVSRRHRAEYF